MFKRIIISSLFAFFTVTGVSAQTIGQPAPDFTLTDSNGAKHSLSDFKGKPVVLEWYNPECPFVVKHYKPGNMQKLQEDYTAKGIVWLTISSSAKGKQGYLTPEKANELMAEHKSKATALLLDDDGTVGKAYDAKTTPHMYVINADGVLVYNGAIDSKNSTKSEDIPNSENYVASALDKLLAGETIETATTEPYGCSVKYASKGWFFG
jgi:peroxiredoxin